MKDLQKQTTTNIQEKSNLIGLLRILLENIINRMNMEK